MVHLLPFIFGMVGQAFQKVWIVNPVRWKVFASESERHLYNGHNICQPCNTSGQYIYTLRTYKKPEQLILVAYTCYTNFKINLKKIQVSYHGRCTFGFSITKFSSALFVVSDIFSCVSSMRFLLDSIFHKYHICD